MNNVKQSDEFKKQLSVLGNIVNNKSLKKKDPKFTKKLDTEILFIKNKNKTKKKN
tara:strand:+ start:305 stop:469 length:165 start_codon:yes stop_codon:yes gene_type:complete